ncbi:hypothetical protein, partial [Enterobacter intestinihominis]
GAARNPPKKTNAPATPPPPGTSPPLLFLPWGLSIDVVRFNLENQIKQNSHIKKLSWRPLQPGVYLGGGRII